MGVEELQKQRESVETPGQLPQHLLGKLLQQLTDSPTFEWSTGNVALMIIAVAKQPCFADRAVTRQWCGEQVVQMPAAPEPILIDRFELQGIQKYLTRAFIELPYISGGDRRLAAVFFMTGL